MKNYAFIDGQNLIRGTMCAKRPWKIDLKKFRTFLYEKYQVEQAYYFIGVYNPNLTKLYTFLRYTHFIPIFREHAKNSLGRKKGNVDTDIVFTVMDTVYRKRISGKIILVSSDGDYKKMVTQLIKDRKLCALMFPNQHWSSLYNKIADKYRVRLYTPEVQKYLKLKK